VGGRYAASARRAPAVAKLVSVVDKPADISFRYIVTTNEMAEGGWTAMVTQVLPPSYGDTVVLPPGSNRPASERGAFELAWAHLRTKHSGLEVALPHKWEDVGG
jgi:hypothetical protein